MSFKLVADFTEVNPANKRFCHTDGLHKVRFTGHEIYAGDDKDRIVMIATITEGPCKGQVIQDGFNTPNKFTDSKKAQQYLRWWKAALLSVGIPESKLKKVNITWKTFEGKTAYCDFVSGDRHEGGEVYDDAVWITPAQYRDMSDANDDLDDDDDVEVDDDDEEYDELEDEDDEVVETKPAPKARKKAAPKKAAGDETKKRAKTVRRRPSKKPPSNGGGDPLDAADALS